MADRDRARRNRETNSPFGIKQGGSNNSVAPSTGDPYWNNVVLLLANEFNANGSTSFVEQSKYARTTTVNGNSQWSTTSPPTGVTSSALFDGVGDYVSVPDSATLELGGNDFTVECYIRSDSGTNNSDPMGKRSASQVENWALYLVNTTIKFSATSNNVSWDIASDRPIGTVNAATWTHVAVTRSGTSWNGFINGVLQAGFAFTSALSIADNTTVTNIGGAGNTAYTGRIAGARITIGTARYTSSFTPPTLPLLTS